MGFCFDPQSPDYISPQNALAIKGWISGPKIVAEFDNQDIDNIKNIIGFLEPDVIEIKNELNFNEGKLPVIIKTSSGDISNIQNENCLFVLVEDYTPGKLLNSPLPVMIDISTIEIPESDSSIAAYQIKGSRESEVGIKDYDKIEEILDKIRTY